MILQDNAGLTPASPALMLLKQKPVHAGYATLTKKHE
jgi:hypothetical protein